MRKKRRFRTGRGYVDQFFNLSMKIEKIVSKERKVHGEFMILEKVHENIYMGLCGLS